MRALLSDPRPSARTLEILRTLVALPTVSRDSNLGLIEWVRDLLSNHGVRTRLSYDAARRKANLFATIGEGRAPGVVLSGHTDTVPVDGQEWHSDPFVATEREGRIHGRGTADMKGFIAVALGLVPQALAAAGGRPLHLAFSYDEEVGCLGVRELVKDLAEAGITAAGCIVGEPTGMRLVLGHKGARAYRCCVRGREVHSSLTPQGVSAIEYAALLITRLRVMAQELRAHERRHPGFDMPHSTLQAGVVRGGIAGNVVAHECEFKFDLRYLGWTDPDQLEARLRRYALDELLPEMRAVAPESEIVIEQVGEVPDFDTPGDAPLARLVRALNGEPREDRYVGFGSEAGLFQRMGVPAVICGPGFIEQAHKPDEYVALAQLARCEEFITALISALPNVMLENPDFPSGNDPYT